MKDVNIVFQWAFVLHIRVRLFFFIIISLYTVSMFSGEYNTRNPAKLISVVVLYNMS